MLIEQCLKLPDLVDRLPEVGYPYEVRACHLRRRAIEIQDAIDELGEDFSYFMRELNSQWSPKEMEEAGL